MSAHDQPSLFGRDADPEIPGFKLMRGRLTKTDQRTLMNEVLMIARVAPWATPTMRKGSPLRLQVTNAGAWGWWSDAKGYRYVDRHPVTGAPWPEIPYMIFMLAHELAADAGFGDWDPDSVLVNKYEDHGSLGLHRDETEETDAAIVSISLGDSCIFRFGGLEKTDKLHDFVLRSGDVVVFGGPARKCYHGVSRIYSGTGSYPGGARWNITIRRVKP